MALELPRVDPNRQRQAAWRQRNVDKMKSNRAYRLQQLQRDRDAIERATRAYRPLDQGHVPAVVLRSQFIRLDTPRRPPTDDVQEPRELSPAQQAYQRDSDIQTRPPLTRLVHRQSSALSLYLTAVYIAHLELQAHPGKAYTNNRKNARTREGRHGWVWMAGMHASSDEHVRRARLRRALDELDSAGLASIHPPGVRGRYEDWKLRSDDGTGGPYVVPSERRPGAVDLPTGFFLNGWHLVLTSGEIAMLLAITHMHRLRGGSSEPGEQPWVALPQSVRRNSYGVSGEVYLHAQQLLEFGLIEFNDPMTNRIRGKINNNRITIIQPLGKEDGGSRQNEPPEKVPYQFRPANPMVFNQNAFTVVQNTLTAYPIPHRFQDFADMIPAQQMLPVHLNAQKQIQRQR